MPNGYTGIFNIGRESFLTVLKSVPGQTLVGTGFTMVGLQRMGEISASEMIRRLGAYKEDTVGVEEEYRTHYTAFVPCPSQSSSESEIFALTISPSSPIYDPFRQGLTPA